MVTRAFDSREVRTFREELGRTQTTIRGTILPALGLGLAFNFLSGGMTGATGAGVAMGQATYGIQTRMAELADRIAVTLLPGLEGVFDVVEDGIDTFADWDERTDGLATRLALAGGAAYLFRGQIASLVGLLGTPVGAGTVGALLAGGLTFNTIRDIQEGGVDRATDPVTSRNAQAARGIQDFITGQLGLPNVRRGFGSGPDYGQQVVQQARDVGGAIAAPVESAQRTVNNYFTITSHSTEQLLAQLQDALDQDLLRVP